MPARDSVEPTWVRVAQVLDRDELDYSRFEADKAFILELVTPLVSRSKYPKANDVDVPWWWHVDDDAQLRQRLEKVIEGGSVYELETVDHGVVVGYQGGRPVETGNPRGHSGREPLEIRLRRAPSKASTSR